MEGSEPRVCMPTATSISEPEWHPSGGSDATPALALARRSWHPGGGCREVGVAVTQDTTNELEESDFLRAVREAFGGPIERGALRVVRSSYDARIFGNAVVELEGRHVRLRVVRDRGDTFAEVAPVRRSDGWAPLEQVVAEVCGVGDPTPRLLAPSEMAQLLESSLGGLEARFGAPREPGIGERIRVLIRRALERLRDDLGG